MDRSTMLSTHSMHPGVSNSAIPAAASATSSDNGTFFLPSNGPSSLLGKQSYTLSSSSLPSVNSSHLSDGNANRGLDNAEALKQAALSGVQSAQGKRERERERRIMPARLQRVSNLLAGSTIEDELSGINPKQEAYILPSQTEVVVYTSGDLGFATSDTHIKPQAVSLFATPAFVSSCRARELIETPDFKTRDDTEMMGKTRAIRSEEDTSDAAYERRHRKPDNLEKKQRRLEKERLVRDRQKLKERIDQLRVADARLLMPILTAREQNQKQSEVESLPSPGATSSGEAAEVGLPGGIRQNLGAEAAQTMAKLELLRAELLEEANETLKRYDDLLTPTDMAPLHPIKRKPGEMGGVEEAGNGSKTVRSISVSGAFAKKNSKGMTSGQEGNRTVSGSGKEKKPRKRKSEPAGNSRSKRLSLGASEPKDPQPFKPEDGPVRAENTYANIHARTSGGRFAPKAALSGTTGSTSKINTKGKWKSEGQPKPKKGQSSASSGKARAVSSSKISANSLIESVSPGENKPKRVKLILNKRRKTAQGAGGESTQSSSSIGVPAMEEVVDSLMEDDDVELQTEPQRVARAALTLEEAQALLAKAMEDDDDEDEEIELQVKRED